jgi:hypothetical protein
MVGFRIVGIAVLLASTVVFLPSLLWETVSFSNKSAQPGVVKSYGYKIDKHWVWYHSFRLVLYSDSVSIKLEPLNRKFDKVMEQRWFCNERMIYLVVQWKYTSDSGGSSTDTTRVIYDFEQGELYTLAPSSSWEVWEPTRERDHYMKQPEFDATLLQLESGCRSPN